MEWTELRGNGCARVLFTMCFVGEDHARQREVGKLIARTTYENRRV